MSKVSKNVRKYVSRKLQADKEVKSLCTQNTTAITSGTWQILCVNKIAEGNTSGQRDGLRVKSHNYEARMALTTNNNPAHLRILILKAKGNDAPTSGELPGEVYGCIPNVGRSKYSVLKDSLMTLNRGYNVYWNGSAAVNVYENRDYVKVLRGKIRHMCKYISSAADAPAEGAVYICFYQNGTTDLTKALEFNYGYTDN